MREGSPFCYTRVNIAILGNAWILSFGWEMGTPVKVSVCKMSLYRANPNQSRKVGRYKAISKWEFELPWRKAGQLHSFRRVSGFRPVGCQYRSLSFNQFHENKRTDQRSPTWGSRHVDGGSSNAISTKDQETHSPNQKFSTTIYLPHNLTMTIS